MRSSKKTVSNKWFQIGLLAVTILTIILRFYNYGQRWGIAYDQAHDALVARYATATLNFPLVAPFSSGAQFQDSGIWYWFLMVPTFLFRDHMLAPWIFTAVFSIIFVLGIYYFACELIDEKFALLIGLIAAISTSEIGQATNLTLTCLMSIVSLGALFSANRYLNTKQAKYLLFFGLFCGLSPSIHLQGVLLIVLIPIFLVVAKIKDLKSISIIAAGFIIPFLSLIIFDLQNNFVNITGLINHLLYKQYQTSYDVLGRRWLTYILNFWPTSWSTILGGNFIAACLLIISSVYVFAEEIYKKTIKPFWIVTISSFLIIAILMRYVRNPLFDSYLNFLHPFVFLICAYAIYRVFAKSRIIGCLLLLIVLTSTLIRDVAEVTYPGNVTTLSTVKSLDSEINSKLGKKKITLYDLDYKQVGISLPLSLRLDVENRIDDAGAPIGIKVSDNSYYDHKIIANSSGFSIVDLTGSSAASLVAAGWHPIDASYIYNSTENWHKK